MNESLTAIKKLYHDLSLPLKQDIAYIYLEKEEEKVEEIGKKLESLYKNKDFRLFLRKLHRQYELREAVELREIFTKRHVFKKNPDQWQAEAKAKLAVFFQNVLKLTNAFEVFEKNLHESHTLPNQPYDKVNQIPQSKLVNGEHVKIAIIGAGFSGLAAAYFLVTSGKIRGSEIAIIEKRKVGGELLEEQQAS